VAWFRDAGYELGLAWALHYRGMVAHAQGDDARAAALLREAMILQRQEGHKARQVESLEGCAELAASHGQAARAARLLGASVAARAAIVAPSSPGEQALRERTITTVRAQLDEATFAAAWADGHAMSLGQALAYALETIA
jgi:hypothetical protein